MKNLGFCKADWFLGLMEAVVMLAAARGELIQSPGQLAGVTNRALAKNPDQRRPSGEQMAKAIRLGLGTLMAIPEAAAAVS